jgi:cytoskeletal protein RodZ
MTAYGFQKKTITAGPSLGQRFRDARKAKKISLSDAELETRIRQPYLEAIEKDELEKLPPAYSKGFIRRYADFLGIEGTSLHADLEHLQPKGAKKQSFRVESLERESRWSLTPKVVITSLVIFLLLGFAAYVTYQVKQFASPPMLEITQPGYESVTKTEQVVIEGKTDPGSLLFIDNLQANVNTDGGFTYNLTVRPGLNKIAVRSQNRLNKESSKTLSVLYEAQTAKAL